MSSQPYRELTTPTCGLVVTIKIIHQELDKNPVGSAREFLLVLPKEWGRGRTPARLEGDL